MKRKFNLKRVMSMLLAVLLVLGCVPSAFAAGAPTVTLTADKTEVLKGETVTLTLSIDEDWEEAYLWQWNIVWDSTYFDATAKSVGPAYKYTAINLNATTVYEAPYKAASVAPGKLDIHTVEAGVIATVTLTAKQDITGENQAKIYVDQINTESGEEYQNADGEWVIRGVAKEVNNATGEDAPIDVTVRAEAPKADTITGAFLDADKSEALEITRDGDYTVETWPGGPVYAMPYYKVSVPAGTENIYLSYVDGIKIADFCDYAKDNTLTDGQSEFSQTSPMVIMPTDIALGTGKVAVLPDVNANYAWCAAVELIEVEAPETPVQKSITVSVDGEAVTPNVSEKDSWWKYITIEEGQDLEFTLTGYDLAGIVGEYPATYEYTQDGGKYTVTAEALAKNPLDDRNKNMMLSSYGIKMEDTSNNLYNIYLQDKVEFYVYAIAVEVKPDAVAQAKEAAIAELEGYADPANYSEANQEALATAVQAGKDAINAAETVDDVEEALDEAKAAIDEIPTKWIVTAGGVEVPVEMKSWNEGTVTVPAGVDVTFRLAGKTIVQTYANMKFNQHTANEDGSVTFAAGFLQSGKYVQLECDTDMWTPMEGYFLVNIVDPVADAKEAAIAELEGYADPANYSEANQETLATAVQAGKDAINAAETVDDVEEALDEAKAAIDEIPTKWIVTAGGVEVLVEMKSWNEGTVTVPAGVDVTFKLAGKTIVQTYANMKFNQHTANEDGSVTFAAGFLQSGKYVQLECDTDMWTPMEGYFLVNIVDLELEQAKEEAKAELAEYKDPADYREAQKAELEAAITAGNKAIDEAKDVAAVEKALEDAKAALDAIKTDAELKAEEAVAALAKAKEDAVKEIEEYKNPEDYRDAQKEELAEAIEEGKAAINAAPDLAGVNTAKGEAKAAIDEIKTDAELTAEEEAAAAALAKAKEEAKAELEEYKDPADYRDAEKEELEAILADADKAIDEAQTAEEIAEIVDAAKAEMDAVKTDAQLKAEEEAAAAAALAKAKEEAKAELEEYKDPADYRDAEKEELAAILADADKAIDEAQTAEEIAEIVDAAKAEMDAVKTDAQLKAEEEAAKDEEKEEEKEEDKNNAPATGDSTVIIFAGIMMLIFMAAIIVVMRKRKAE